MLILFNYFCLFSGSKIKITFKVRNLLLNSIQWSVSTTLRTNPEAGDKDQHQTWKSKHLIIQALIRSLCLHALHPPRVEYHNCMRRRLITCAFSHTRISDMRLIISVGYLRLGRVDLGACIKVQSSLLREMVIQSWLRLKSSTRMAYRYKP